MSLGVDIPESHNSIFFVKSYRREQKYSTKAVKAIKHFIKIQYSEDSPRNSFIGVEYNDFYFYIENSDLISKETFALLQSIYMLQVDNYKTQQPILTFPIN